MVLSAQPAGGGARPPPGPGASDVLRGPVRLRRGPQQQPRHGVGRRLLHHLGAALCPARARVFGTQQQVRTCIKKKIQFSKK